MSEAKTKKLLFSLFLIPLAAFVLSLAPTLLGTNSAFAATITEYTISDDGKTITEKITGTIEQPCTTQNVCPAPLPVNTTTVYSATGADGLYKGTGGCPAEITVTGTPIAGGTVNASVQRYAGQIEPCVKSGGATTINGLTAGANFDEAAFTTAALNGGTDPDAEDEDTTSCTIDGIGWLLCPVIDFGAKIADSALGFLSNNFLETKVGLYATLDANGQPSPTFSAWQWILGFANIIFVIVFLLIIFSQATGYGISNYGVKKMLPKLIIGVVLINLSFFICQIMVDASNILGYGINHFLDTIAQGITVAGDDDPLSKGSPFGGIAAVILTTAGIGLALYAALAFFAPVLVAAIVGLLLIFLFLVARQALIILGIIIAPLAFAAWLLPNTEKLFKRWWSIFVQLLLLFPIIALVFGVSKLVSKIIASVYAGGGGNVEGGLAAASTVPTSGNFIGQVIAAAVLVVPLFAVPFLLKGAISGIPVVGSLAAKGYRNATQGSRKRTAGFTDPAFAGLRAQQRAGIRGWGGRSRVKRDENGNILTDDKGRMIGKNGQPLRRTASQVISDTKRSLDESEKSYEALGSAQYENRALNSSLGGPATLAANAKKRSEQAEALSSRAKAGFGSELSEQKADPTTALGRLDAQRQQFADQAGLSDKKLADTWETARAVPDSAAGKQLRAAGVDTDALRQRNVQSQGYTRAAQTIKGRQEQNYASDLQTDPTLLNIAAAKEVDQYGALKAEAYGVQAVRSAQSANVSANMVQVSDQVRRKVAENAAAGVRLPVLNKDGSQKIDTDTGKPATRAYRDLDALQEQFTAAANAGDTDRLKAVATGMLKTGAGGFDGLEKSLGQNHAAIKSNPDVSRDFRGYMVDEHSKDLKVRSRGTLQYMFDGEPIDHSKVGSDPKVTESVRDMYNNLTPSESASQTESSMQKAVASGGFDLTRAQAVLREDGLVQNMTNGQIATMASALDQAYNPKATDPLEKERHIAAIATAKVISTGDTFPRFDPGLKAKILDMAGEKWDPTKTGGEPRPGPASSGSSTSSDDSAPYSADDKGGIGGDDD